MVLAVKTSKPKEELKDEPKAEEVKAKAEPVQEPEVEPDTTMAEDIVNTDDQVDQDAGDGEVVDNDSVIEGQAEVIHDDDSAAQVAEPEAAAEPEATAKPTQQVAAKPTNTGVAVAKPSAANSAMQTIMDQLQEEGQEGLELGFGVFPMLSMDKGEFKIGDTDIGDTPFAGVPLHSVPKYAYRLTGVADKDADVVFADTDQEMKDPESMVSKRVLEWKEKFPGSDVDIKKYQNVVFFLSDIPGAPEYQGRIVILSVSPQSIKHYTNACITVKGRGYSAHECVFQVLVGEKVRGQFDFYPWDFKALGSCKKLGVEVTFGGERDESF